MNTSKWEFRIDVVYAMPILAALYMWHPSLWFQVPMDILAFICLLGAAVMLTAWKQINIIGSPITLKWVFQEALFTLGGVLALMDGLTFVAISTFVVIGIAVAAKLYAPFARG